MSINRAKKIETNRKSKRKKKDGFKRKVKQSLVYLSNLNRKKIIKI